MKKIRVKLDEVLKNKDLTQKQLAEMTGLRAASISELYNNQRTSINKEHLQKIAEALNINDISELLELTDAQQ
ncbi:MULTISPECIES: helix-turn-helix domain-containing protein [Cytobacillus]|uniref:helix-turn-helix domain-containing protein n=1 Tax=Cytobacillus TaxID=2675230 RepID=UPI00203B60FC|nr:helix-turn-helix transcriptional regulator [Cytobacillus firmus]MCM3705850.1 helix-turn-helix transcriptional regulator [Cytobacillus firmus]